MDPHARRSSRSSAAVFWRRRIVVLVIAGVLVGMVFWPLDRWLFGDASEGAAARQASSETDEAAASGQHTGGDDGKQGNGQQRDGQQGGAQQGGARDGRQAGERDTRRADERKAPEEAERDGPAKAADAGADPGADTGGQAEARNRKPDVPVCAGEDLTVTVRPDRDSTPAGREMTFRLRVRNGGEHPCQVPPDPAHVRVAVLAGSDRVLDTDRCPAAISVRPARIRPGKSGIISVQWNGRRTARSCSADAPPAEPGSYSVQGSVLGAFSAPAPFRLS